MKSAQEALSALAEVCSMRFVHGVSTWAGLMGIDYPTAAWLSRQDDVFRLCLVREMKIFGYHIGCFRDVRRGFRILIKKLIT